MDAHYNVSRRGQVGHAFQLGFVHPEDGFIFLQLFVFILFSSSLFPRLFALLSTNHAFFLPPLLSFRQYMFKPRLRQSTHPSDDCSDCGARE